MKVVLTDDSSVFGSRVAGALKKNHSVVVLEDTFAPRVAESPAAAMGELDKQLHGLAVLVHIPSLLWETSSDDPEREQVQLDAGTRQFHDLLTAAVRQGAKSVVYVGSLSVMDGYPKDHAVTEHWRPSPMPNSRDLGLYLGELVLREFTRQHRISALCLRVDEAVWKGEPALVELMTLLCVRAVESKLGEGAFLVRHVDPRLLTEHEARLRQPVAPEGAARP